MPLALFLARLPQSRTARVPGLAVFLTDQPDYVPTSLLHNLKQQALPSGVWQMLVRGRSPQQPDRAAGEGAGGAIWRLAAGGPLPGGKVLIRPTSGPNRA